MNTRHISLALGLAAALAAPAAAAAASASSATASFSNLTFRLIDLTPDDGIGPTASFSGTGLLGIAAWSEDFLDMAPVVFTGFLPFTPQAINHKQSSAAFLIDGLSTTAAPDTDHLTRTRSELSAEHVDERRSYLKVESMGTTAAILGTDGSAAQGPEPVSPTYTIVLGANTGLIIEGRAAASATWSPDTQAALTAALLAFAAETPDAQTNAQNALISSRAATSAFLQFSDAPPPDFYLGDDRILTVEALALSYDTPGTVSSAQDFSLQLLNTGAQSRNASLLLQASAYVESTASVVLIEQIGAIPEPGTYALMGLGLVGLALARSRHAA